MKKLISIIFAMTASVAVARDYDVKRCDRIDNYLGSELMFEHCEDIQFGICMRYLHDAGVDRIKTYKEIAISCQKHVARLELDAVDCAKKLRLNSSDFLKIQECYR